MLIDHDGRKVHAIRDVLTSSEDNLIVEEFDVFSGDGYYAAAQQIFSDAKKLLARQQASLAIDAGRLHMFRGLKRGRRVFAEDASNDASGCKLANPDA